MTQLLELAVKELAKLPAPEQDALAAMVLREIQSEQQWADTFTKSQDMLAQLANDAVAEHAAGRTQAFPQ